MLNPSLSSLFINLQAGRRLFSLFALILIYLSLIFSTASFAQSYSAGYNKYVQGDFEGAEMSFQATLDQNLSTAEKARIYKMLGITQYMQGKRISAEASFRSAKELNSFIDISPSEVLDESVVSFFNAIEVEPQPKAATSHREKSKKETLLKIYVSPAYGNVALDGVPLGRVDKLIKVSPGFHSIEISARNYQTHRQPIDVKAGQVNHVSINLTRITRERTPQVVPKPSRTKSVKAEKPAKVAAPASEKKERRERLKRSRKKPRVAKSKTSRRQPRKKRRRSLRGNSGNGSKHSNPNQIAPLLLLPFGAGQFATKQVLLGVGSGVIQALSLFTAIQQWREADAIVVQTDEEIKRRDLARQEIADTEQFQADLAEAVQFQKQRQTQVDSLYQNSMIAGGVFSAIWIGSVVQAYFKSTSQRSVARLYDRYSPLLVGAIEKDLESIAWSDKNETPWEIDFKPHAYLLRDPTNLNLPPQYQVSIQVKKTF